MSVIKVEHGRAVFALEPAEWMYNPIGSVHGGVAATILDSCMGCAVHTTLDAGVGYATTDLRFATCARCVPVTGGSWPRAGWCMPGAARRRLRAGYSSRATRTAARPRQHGLHDPPLKRWLTPRRGGRCARRPHRRSSSAPQRSARARSCGGRARVSSSTSRAPGIVRARRLPIRAGMTGSRRPQTSSVGAAIEAASRRRSCSGEASCATAR